MDEKEEVTYARKALIFSGPSGSGKTSLIKSLISKYPEQITMSVSCTTRAPRVGEKEGVDYFFKTPEEFAEQKREGHFIETATYAGEEYGTSYEAMKPRKPGSIVAFDLDYRGVQQMKCKLPDRAEAKYLYIIAENQEMSKLLIKKRDNDIDETELNERVNSEYEQAESYANGHDWYEGKKPEPEDGQKTEDAKSSPYDKRFVNRISKFDELQTEVESFLQELGWL